MEAKESIEKLTEMSKTKKSAVIYSRVSSVSDRQNTERQVVDLSNYAMYNDMEVVRVFEEHASGGLATKDRPVLGECLEYCFSNKVDTLLVSELSRLGRNADDVLANVRRCKETGLNVHFQKERLSIFDSEGKESPFLTIMIAVLSTCAELERDNIQFRLNSGRARYVAKGGKLGRPAGSLKSKEDKAAEYSEVIKLLKRGVSVRNTVKLTGKSMSTVMRVKKEFDI